MNIVLASALKQSCLIHVTKGPDHVIRATESFKFMTDARSLCPIQFFATRRLIPLALNHMGLRGGHFQAILKEFATILVTRTCGCSLLQGPFAQTLNGALHKILNT
jgi:hypothetical protein